MNLDPEVLNKTFLEWHAVNKRNKKNRDRMVLNPPSHGFSRRDRFTLRPSHGTWLEKPTKHYIPTPDCDWIFDLYGDDIVTIHRDQTATLNLSWYGETMWRHVRYVLPKIYFAWWKPNKWTHGAYHLWWGEGKHCELTKGMKISTETSAPLNPTPNKVVIVDYADPRVKEIRKNLRVIKTRYMPLARMHATSNHATTDPFYGIKACNTPTYEWLSKEKEASAQTYVELVRWRGKLPHCWHAQRYNPVKTLNKHIEEMKTKLYQQYLIQEVR